MNGMVNGKMTTLVAVEVVLIVIGSTIIIVIYDWMLPKLFAGFKAYSVVILGTCASAILGGTVARWFMGGSPTAASWLAIVGVGLAVGLSVMALSIGFLISLLGA
jgi:hypothetical protein